MQAYQVFTPNQLVTITLASLANNAVATSNFIDNTTNGFLSAEFQLMVKTGGSVTATPIVSMYLIRCVDGNDFGQFDDATTINAELLRQISTPVAATTYVASVRIESLPQIFSIVVSNNTGGALDSTAGNFYLKYVGKSVQVM